jgi:hypothetical protein
MFNSFNVGFLRVRIEVENGEKPGKRLVPLLDVAGDFASFGGQDQSPYFS